MNVLEEKFDAFLKRHPNPVGAKKEDELSAFLRELDKKGELKTFSEADWIETGRSFGLNDHEIAEWIEQAAGWLGKEPRGMQPAGWTDLAPQR